MPETSLKVTNPDNGKLTEWPEVIKTTTNYVQTLNAIDYDRIVVWI